MFGRSLCGTVFGATAASEISFGVLYSEWRPNGDRSGPASECYAVAVAAFAVALAGQSSQRHGWPRCSPAAIRADHGNAAAHDRIRLQAACGRNCYTSHTMLPYNRRGDSTIQVLGPTTAQRPGPPDWRCVRLRPHGPQRWVLPVPNKSSTRPAAPAAAVRMLLRRASRTGSGGPDARLLSAHSRYERTTSGRGPAGALRGRRCQLAARGLWGGDSAANLVLVSNRAACFAADHRIPKTRSVACCTPRRQNPSPRGCSARWLTGRCQETRG
ncbi:uncharacterized protein V1510DRAFT_422852 [Dipodascopsis tothii]|uniref:uncharacterized protein n=1 Tax=Dipodascopsis tothii TaxID=44089 RepID=UPI0034CDD6DD